MDDASCLVPGPRRQFCPPEAPALMCTVCIFLWDHTALGQSSAERKARRRLKAKGHEVDCLGPQDVQPDPGNQLQNVTFDHEIATCEPTFPGTRPARLHQDVARARPGLLEPEQLSWGAVLVSHPVQAFLCEACCPIGTKRMLAARGERRQRWESLIAG